MKFPKIRICLFRVRVSVVAMAVSPQRPPESTNSHSIAQSRCATALRSLSRSSAVPRFVIPCRVVPRQHITHSECLSSYSRAAFGAQRWSSTEAAPSTSTSANPTITRIVDDIAGLTLLQAADLVAQLKVRVHVLRRSHSESS